ncbi:MAG TPA: L,D-transpeptidase family protein, partial [Sphingomonas sp.]
MRAGSRWKIACAAAIGFALTAGSMPFAGSHRWRWHHRRHHAAASHRVAAAVPNWTGTALTIADADGLRPGRYIWQGVADSPAPVSMVIDLGRQVAFVYQGYALVGITTVSTGRRGHSTPAGVFPILQKQVWHRSTLYSGAPMPYMQR